ncbi:DUF4169 family protein [Vannielia litorea]|uniref:DUF4169 family protein n=1 Tax=Vannielia litorea TaxID=1217970 RepID=UPI001C938B48|nr:DUF4169 family protein [Vannielia litorea]MBY6047014.1 DUF4169 family protein [Vannielia litorea]MBY6074428.1 DUF4169 family protein [Vannielia litorea]
MSDKPVNLNRVRKDKARAEKKARADQNAAFHGLTKAQKEQAKAEAARVARLHDQSKRDES